MLTDTSYYTAIAIYAGAALLMLLYVALWLRRRLRPVTVLALFLLCAALLLTPAYPRDGVDTMAPALVVVCFQLFTEGYEAAQHAIRPLAAAVGLALVLAAIGGLFPALRAKPGRA